jgi:hypothetical protein
MKSKLNEARKRILAKCICEPNSQEPCENCYFDIKEVGALLSYIDSLHKQIEEAREIVDFYADADSWGHESPASTTYSVIDRDDLGDGSFQFNEITDDERVGGKRARVYLAKCKDGDND